MRLPADVVLLILDPEANGPAAALETVWRREGLPTLSGAANDAFVSDALEPKLEALGATTLVLAGGTGADGFQRAAIRAAELGFRLFVPIEACPAGVSFPGLDPTDIRLVRLADTMIAAAQAKARERWRAARAQTANRDGSA